MASSVASDGDRILSAAMLAVLYMQAVTISLPNAALLHIQGSLSMADDEVGWIFTSYLTASIVTLMMTQWLSARYGRKVIYQISIVTFAFGLILTTHAETPLQFIGARIIQGGASGPLAPLSVAILADVLPPASRGRIDLMAAVTLVTGLLSGPPIGGWLSEYHGWRSLFYVGLPVAGFVFLAVALSLPEQRASKAPPFDFFGFITFSTGIVGLQVMLDRGERMEWFASTEVCAEGVIAGVGLYLYLVHILTARRHFLDKSLFRDRNFVLSAAMYFALGFVLLPTIALTSPMLDELLNYPADTTGYLSIPRSLGLIGALIIAGRMSERFDRRLLLAGGMALVIYGNWRMLDYAPGMDWRPVVLAGVVQGVGLGILLPTMTKSAFSTLDPAYRAEGTAFFNLTRVYGSTIGIAVVLTFFYDNTQAMHVALAKDLSPYRATAKMAGTLTAPGLAALNDRISGQAALIGVIGQFKVMMIVMMIVSPLVLFLRNPGEKSR